MKGALATSRASHRAGPGQPSRQPIRLMIVDNSMVARAVLSRMIDADGNFEIAAIAGHGRRRHRSAWPGNGRHRPARPGDAGRGRSQGIAANPRGGKRGEGADRVISRRGRGGRDGGRAGARRRTTRSQSPAPAGSTADFRKFCSASCASLAMLIAVRSAWPPARRSREQFRLKPRSRFGCLPSGPRPAGFTPSAPSLQHYRRGLAFLSWSPSIFRRPS